MKLSIAFAITRLLAVAFLSIANASLTVECDSYLPTEPVPRLTSSQESALRMLALDDETHKRVVERVDPPKVGKFIELHKLFKEGNVKSTVTCKEEAFDRAVAYVPCEIAWHLQIIEFDETIQCLENSASWKERTKVGDKVLVNFFADKHAFELIQLLKTTDVGDEELFLTIQKVLSSKGIFSSASTAFFLQHALALHKQSPTSLERQEMVKNFLSLHLSAIAVESSDQQMLNALYSELPCDASTLFTGSLPKHAIAVVATRVEKDKYDIVIVNSGGGIRNHESTTEIQPKGFHTGASYGGVSTGKPIKATSYNPLLRMEGVTGAQLAAAHYHSGTMDQVYYVKRSAGSCVVREPRMPWEWTESQGIGSCAATSVWFALHFYYQALGYENDIRLSMLDQAIGDLKELQDKAEDLERQMNADYQKAREAFRKTHRKTVYFPYDQDRVKDLKPAKDKAEKSLHLRRTIISMALNEILRNLIVWQHELGDISAGLLIKNKDKKLSKMRQRCKILEKAIPQSMASFHSFWALQEEKYLKRQQETADTEAELSSVLDSWQSIRVDVRTMYNDAIEVTKIKPGFATALAKKPIVKRTFKPINVTSLKEHASLRRILSYIVNFGDSPALRGAVSRHLRAHTENANAAKYLITLHACLAKNAPLLEYLFVVQELPLRYAIDTTKKDSNASAYWDLTTEGSIAALAAHEFSQHGQPLNSFPELFKKPQKETQGIVDRFKDAYTDIAPIVNAEAPSQDDVDEAFKALVKQGRIAAIAYILPKTSKKAIRSAFFRTKNVRVLRLLIDLVQGSKVLKQKMEKSIKEDNAGIVELLLPFHLRHEKYVAEKDLIKKQRTHGSAPTDESAEVNPLDRLLEAAYDGDAVKVMELLASFTDKSVIIELLSAAISDRKSEMTRVLFRYVADGTVFAVIESANARGDGGSAKVLSEEYARRKPTEASFLKAAEQGSLDELEDWILRINADVVGYALFKTAEKGKMDCFEKLVPHATADWIVSALSKLSDENLAHPSVLKAANNASTFLAYMEIVGRATAASNTDLLVHMLPFISAYATDRFFNVACKNAKSFEITKHLLQFVENDSVDDCLEAAVSEKMEDNVVLLLPRTSRKKLAAISQSPEFIELSKDTKQAITDRIERFPTEIAIELAFLPKDKRDIRASLEAELGEDDPVCKGQQKCIAKVESDPAAVAFSVEQAARRLLERRKDSVALAKLVPFSTPYACAQIAAYFSRHGSVKAVKACAKKLLKADVSNAVRLARDKENFKLVEFLVPFLSPLGIIGLLQVGFFPQQVDAGHLKDMLASLPEALADDALRIAVRESKTARETYVHNLLPKASPAAIDEAYLFAKRISFDYEPLEKAASPMAMAQGREIERGRGAK